MCATRCWDAKPACGSRNWSSGPAHSARGGRGEPQATEDRAHRSLLGAYARRRHSFGGEIALVANVVTAVLVNFAMTAWSIASPQPCVCFLEVLESTCTASRASK